MTSLSMSAEEWIAAGLGTAEKWRTKALAEWKQIKASPHWHAGTACAAMTPACPNGRESAR